MNLQRLSPVFLLISALSMVLLAPAGVGQEVAGGIGGIGVRGASNLPYSAHFVTTRVQTLADGTTITHVTRQFRARDSQGRTRTEMYPSENDSPGQNAGPITVIIVDPVAAQYIFLNPRMKTAHVTAFPSAHAAVRFPDLQGGMESTSPTSGFSTGAGAALSALPAPLPQPMVPRPTLPRPPLPRPTVEKLPPQTLDNLAVEGMRTTAVIPAGRMGNDRDLTIVHEIWRSPELGIGVLQKTSDPRSGETTTEIKDLSRDEPSPDLFQIPPDYQVIQPRQE